MSEEPGRKRATRARRAAQEVASAARWVHIDDLQRWARNPRKNDGDNPATDAVARSIQAFGFIAPVVVWTSRKRLVAGDTLLAEDPNYTPRHAPGPGLVPVREVEFTSEAEADAYALADNRLGELAEWDDAGLVAVLRDLEAAAAAAEVDLGSIGWTEREMKALLATGGDPSGLGDEGIEYEEKYAVLVRCRDEKHQKEVYEHLEGLGYEVKVLAL